MPPTKSSNNGTLAAAQLLPTSDVHSSSTDGSTFEGHCFVRNSTRSHPDTRGSSPKDTISTLINVENTKINKKRPEFKNTIVLNEAGVLVLWLWEEIRFPKNVTSNPNAATWTDILYINLL